MQYVNVTPFMPFSFEKQQHLYDLFPLQSKRNPGEVTLYRGAVAPESGGKVPEAAHMRIELNKIDAMGFNDPHALRMVDALKDTPLPEKVSVGLPPAPHGYHGPAPHGHPASP